jgi:hypothetical protein
MTLNVTHSFSAGASIVASEMNANFNDVEAYINSSPGVLIKTGGTVTGAVTMSGGITVSGDATFDTTTLKVDSTNNKVGFMTATPHTFPPTPANRSPYNTNSGGGGTGSDRSTRAEYRIVNTGSVYVDGDVIGWTAYDDNAGSWRTEGTGAGEYEPGSGTRINTQWINVRGNADVSGEIRVGSRYQTATLYFGDEYSADQDYIQWKDNLPTTNLPGFQFVHNDNAHLTISESGSVGSEVLDLRAANGWPTLSSTTTAGITTTGSNQLGKVSSSSRYKEEIADLDVATAKTKVAGLRPRTFKWNETVATASGMDYATQGDETGLIAEEVASAAADWVSYNDDDTPETWRHQSVLSAVVAVVQDLESRVGALE